MNQPHLSYKENNENQRYLLASVSSKLQPSEWRVNQGGPRQADKVAHLLMASASVSLAVKTLRSYCLEFISKGRLTSAPYSPTSFAIGPTYQTCAMHKIAPAQPTRKATNAAIPCGNCSGVFQTVQS